MQVAAFPCWMPCREIARIDLENYWWQKKPAGLTMSETSKNELPKPTQLLRHRETKKRKLPFDVFAARSAQEHSIHHNLRPRNRCTHWRGKTAEDEGLISASNMLSLLPCVKFIRPRARSHRTGIPKSRRLARRKVRKCHKKFTKLHASAL